MTPADELRAAAEKLRPLAETAQHDLETADYWKPYTSDAWAHGFINGFGGPSSDYAAVLPPAVGLALADWLDIAAEYAERWPPDAQTNSPFRAGALAVARAINGGGQP
ncbi:hypothetical protein [Streptomyces sp. A012304]|uniref:hypothetical protein n=1 Tax=Streptomyces sp. A012304 TaxID=375446 RepID=UPI002230228B|nr:hypothetical protein [Streptomyces sp. A012304]GKQ35156.1 hypothetical protein ALMP_17020 [Streptomyces sp. A012304]